jgi:hypothetical protein
MLLMRGSLMKHVCILVAVVLVAACLLPVGAIADCNTQVQINMVADIGLGTGTWTATGLINSSGTIRTHPFTASFHLDPYPHHVVHDDIEVSDENGTFIMTLRGKLETNGQFEYEWDWVIRNGTGAYEGVHAVGRAWGFPTGSTFPIEGSGFGCFDNRAQ